MKFKMWQSSWCMALAVAIPVMALAAAPTSKPKNGPPAKSVDLFAGIDAGEVEAVMIMKDSKEGTVIVRNKTDKPLTVKIPEAFGGVPILAQMGGMGMGGMGGGGMGGGMGGMGGGMGGGMFNIAPDKVQKVKIGTVCLDHGLADPNPRIPYKPVPIESYAKDPAIAELVKLMCSGQIDQHSAQAAAWHIQNGLSWEALADKVGVKHINGLKEPMFTPAHLQKAFIAARVSKELAEKAAKEKSTSPGEESERRSQAEKLKSE